MPVSVRTVSSSQPSTPFFYPKLNSLGFSPSTDSRSGNRWNGDFLNWSWHAWEAKKKSRRRWLLCYTRQSLRVAHHLWKLRPVEMQRTETRKKQANAAFWQSQEGEGRKESSQGEANRQATGAQLKWSFIKHKRLQLDRNIPNAIIPQINTKEKWKDREQWSVINNSPTWLGTKPTMIVSRDVRPLQS